MLVGSVAILVGVALILILVVPVFVRIPVEVESFVEPVFVMILVVRMIAASHLAIVGTPVKIA